MKIHLTTRKKILCNICNNLFFPYIAYDSWESPNICTDCISQMEDEAKEQSLKENLQLESYIKMNLTMSSLISSTTLNFLVD